MNKKLMIMATAIMVGTNFSSIVPVMLNGSHEVNAAEENIETKQVNIHFVDHFGNVVEKKSIDVPLKDNYATLKPHELCPEGYTYVNGIKEAIPLNGSNPTDIELEVTKAHSINVKYVDSVSGDIIEEDNVMIPDYFGGYSTFDSFYSVPDGYSEEGVLDSFKDIDGSEEIDDGVLNIYVTKQPYKTVEYVGDDGKIIKSSEVSEDSRIQVPDGYQAKKTNSVGQAAFTVKDGKIQIPVIARINTLQVMFVDSSTGEIVETKSFDEDSETKNRFFIYAPNGYDLDEHVDGIFDNPKSLSETVFVTSKSNQNVKTKYTVNYVDETGKLVSSSEAFVSEGNILLNSTRPAGYISAEMMSDLDFWTQKTVDGKTEYTTAVVKAKRTIDVTFLDFDGTIVGHGTEICDENGQVTTEAEIPAGYQYSTEYSKDRYQAPWTGKYTQYVARVGESKDREIALLQRRLADVQDKYDALNKRVDSTSTGSQDSSMAKQLTDLKNSSDSLKKQIATLTSQLSGSQQSTKDLQSKYDALQKQFNDLKASQTTGAQYSALQKKVDALKQQLADQNKQSATSQSKFDALQQQIDALTKKLAQQSSSRPSTSVVKATKTITVSAVAKVNAKTNAPLYDVRFKATNRKLAANTNWNVKALVTGADGKLYYLVGKSQYLRADQAALTMKKKQSAKTALIKMRGVATVKYVKGYGIQLWGSDFKTQIKDKNGKSRKMMHNSSWKAFATAVKNGHTYYQVGTNQWIDAGYAVLK